jgi:hypothetical protein
MHIGLNEAEDYMSIVQPLWCCAPGTTASPIGKFISGNWQINIKSMLPLPVTQSIEALAEFDPNTAIGQMSRRKLPLWPARIRQQAPNAGHSNYWNRRRVSSRT